MKPLVKMLSFAAGGVAPEIMGIGPVQAIPKALKLAVHSRNEAKKFAVRHGDHLHWRRHGCGGDFREFGMMTRERNLRILLVVGDILALLLFVFIGQTDHQTNDASNPLGSLMLAGAPFVVAWLLTAFLLGAYRADVFAPRVMLTRSLTAWLIALPIGIVLRALLLGRAVIPTAFVLVAFAFGGLFVIGWRMILALLMRWRGSAVTE